MRALVASVAVLVMAGFAVAEDEKIDAKKLIGKWEPVKAEEGAPKMTLEIKEKGKFTISVTINDKAQQIEGTYKLDGNKLEVEMKLGEETMKDTLTILKLSDTEFTTKDSKGKEETMKKVK